MSWGPPPPSPRLRSARSSGRRAPRGRDRRRAHRRGRRRRGRGVREKGKEGAEQKKRRKDYVDRIRKEIRAIVPAHSLTDADRDLVRVHWRRAMRTLRVKLIAEDSNDNATIARCDALLAKMDQQLFDKLKELHKKGAAAPAKDGGK
ncbi:MAG: hypothetical protein U0235_32240 [Polyangiaceae bacterium]